MTRASNTVPIESWPFQYSGKTYERNETLQNCAVQLTSDAADWAGDNHHPPDIRALANECNDGEGFEAPLGYPYDGPNSQLKPADLREVVERAIALYNDMQEVLKTP